MVKEPPAPRAGGERTEQVQEERGGDMGDNGALSSSPWLPPCLSFPQHPAGGEGHQPPPAAAATGGSGDPTAAPTPPAGCSTCPTGACSVAGPPSCPHHPQLPHSSCHPGIQGMRVTGSPLRGQGCGVGGSVPPRRGFWLRWQRLRWRLMAHAQRLPPVSSDEPVPAGSRRAQCGAGLRRRWHRTARGDAEGTMAHAPTPAMTHTKPRALRTS